MTVQFIPLKDIKKDVEFWLSALSNPHINMANVELLNRCLENDLMTHLYPVIKLNKS